MSQVASPMKYVRAIHQAFGKINFWNCDFSKILTFIGICEIKSLGKRKPLQFKNI